MGGSDNGNAHAKVDVSTDLGTGFSHCSASKAESFFNEVLASLPRRPSAMIELKSLRLSCTQQQSANAFHRLL
jgi:hypothetical protein